jgi:GrpB-like predicted nucleotidyltransferase (UPF0157 family)
VTGVRLVPHDPSWPAQAEALCAAWRRLPGAVAAHHIGSTALAIDAKPVLDLLPLFASRAALDAARPAIEAMGYAWRGGNGIAGRRYCTRPATGSVPPVHAHAFADGDPEAARHLRLRDHLRRFPARAAAYQAEKRRCAALHPTDRAAYTACKAPLIALLDAEAAR